ncbi:MAG TPA: putative toxin-antitoxin system toxin component, PIN family, partial [Longimicrobium sp.]|nr:putative toxin-antitoxin system toxin component, PIN family [Longimicrobium sp.]
MLRVVLDTSVYVSGFLVPHGLPAQVLDAWRAGRFTVLSSPDILDEVRSTLRKRRIRRRYPIDDGDVDEYVAFIQKR